MLLIVNHIMSLVKDYNRVVEIDANAISNFRVEYGGIRKADDITTFDKISSAIVRT